MQQFWINHPLICIFENTIANFSASILNRFGWNFIWRYRIHRERRLCYSFPNCFQNFPQIFLNWKIGHFFLQNSSRAAYLSRFSLSIRNFMSFGRKLREKSLQRYLQFFLWPRLKGLVYLWTPNFRSYLIGWKKNNKSNQSEKFYGYLLAWKLDLAAILPRLCIFFSVSTATCAQLAYLEIKMIRIII